MITNRYCNLCGNPLVIGDDYSEVDAKYRVYKHKSCAAKQQRERRAATREETNERAKVYNKRWRQNNPEKMRESVRRSRQRRKEREAEKGPDAR